MPETDVPPPPAESGPRGGASSYGEWCVDRTDEATRLLSAILAAEGKIVVIHGRRGSGKTELLRRWVIPGFPEGREAYHGSCSPSLPDRVEGRGGDLPLAEALERKCFLCLDSFDRFLLLPSTARNEDLGTLLRRAAGVTLVLVVNDESLGELLALRSDAPALLENLLEVEGIPLREGLERLSAAPEGSQCSYSPEVISALEGELARLKPRERGRDPELLKVLDSQAPSLIGPDSRGVFRKEDLDKAGGLRGVLRGHLECRIAEVRHALGSPAGEVAVAILEEVVLAQRAGGEPDFAEIPCRLDVDEKCCQDALAWLSAPGRLLREGGSGLLELAPVQLGQIIEEGLEWKRREIHDAQGILDMGLRSWKDLRMALPPDLFREVHGRRASLRTSQEEAALLVHCALRHAEQEDVGPASYWLARIRERAGRITTLLEALYDQSPAVRRRAALLLKDFDEPEVRSQLYRAAIEDAEAPVRREAACSLDGMQKTGFWEYLALEAKQASSPYRGGAIEALRIFRDDRTAQVLKELVSEPASELEVRTKAIETLGAMEHAGAARALADIALDDEDADDRRNAAETLASLRSEELAREAISALQKGKPPGGKPRRTRELGALWRVPANVLLAVLVLVSNVVVHGSALLALRRYRLAIVFLLAEAAVVVALVAGAPFSAWYLLVGTFAGSVFAAAGILLVRRARVEVRLASFHGILGVGLFVATALIAYFSLHGLSHLLVKRFRAGLVILGWELLGLLCYVFYLLDETYFEVFEITHLGPVFLWTFVVLFVATWLYDVGRVGWQCVLFPRRAMARERRTAVYDRVLPKPHFTKAMLSGAYREGPRFVAGALKRSEGEEILGAIECLWPEADRSMRIRIVKILAGHASARSLAYLGKLRAQLGWRAKARCAWARAHYRLKFIPIPVWLVMFMAGSLAVEATPVFMDWSRLPVKFIRSPKAASEQPDLVVKTARFLAEAFPEKSGDEVPMALGRVLRQSADRRPRLDAVDFLAALAGTAGQRAMAQQARKTLSESSSELERMLSDPGVQRAEKRKVFGALEAAGDDRAVGALKSFAISMSSRSSPERLEGPRAGQAEDARSDAEFLGLEAVRSLGRMRTRAAGQALDELAGVPALREVARAEAGQMRTRLLARARLALDEGNYEEAVQAGRDLLALGPDDRKERAGLLALLGEASHRLAPLDLPRSAELDAQATKYLEEARSLGSLDGGTARLLASSYERQAERLLSAKQPEKALSVIAKALQVDPRYAEALGTLGQIHLEMKDPRQALVAFSEATRIEPRYAWAYGMQSWILLDQKDYIPSAQYAQKAIAADPDFAWSYSLLAESYHRQGKDREAIRHLEQLHAQYPQNRWPVQAQMYVYHEHLSAVDASAYGRNYELYKELMDKLGDDTEETEAGFIEANLTTGRYQAVLGRGEKLLGATQKDNLRLPVGLIVYAACVLNGDSKTARVSLDRLEKLVRGLPEDFAPGWSYAGTLNYLKMQALAREVKDPLVELVSAVDESPRAVRAEVFEANRRALGRVRRDAR